MEANPHIDILECGGIQYLTALKKIRIIYRKPGINFGKSTNDIFYHGFSGMGLIIKRSALAKTGIFPITMVGDLSFIINSIKKGEKVKFCRIKLYKQFIHKTNISLNPQVPGSLYNTVKQFAPKKYYFLYAANYYIKKNPVLKIFFYPLIYLHNIYYKSVFIDPGNKTKNKKYNWDGGFS